MDFESQYMFATSDGQLWLVVRDGNGAWTNLQQLNFSYVGPHGVVSPCGPANNISAASLVYPQADYFFTNQNGEFWHVFRLQDGSWTPVDDVRSILGIAFIPAWRVMDSAACVGDGVANFIFFNEDGTLRHATRNELFSPVTWGGPDDLTSALGIANSVTGVGAAGASGAPAQYMFTTSDGRLWYTTTTQPSGNIWTAPLDVRAQFRTDPGEVLGVSGACADFQQSPTGITIQTQWLFVTSIGHAWHTIRHYDGTWTLTDFSGQFGIPDPPAGTYFHWGIAGVGNGGTGSTFFAFAPPDGRLRTQSGYPTAPGPLR
jgi:hypothetical protein